MEKQLIIDSIPTIYSISDSGNIKNMKTGKILKISKRGTVQLSVNQKNKAYTMGRLIAETFLPKPADKDLVIHIDGNLENNNIENLKWISNQENVKLVWEKRRTNGTTGAGIKREAKTKRENIVEKIEETLLSKNEKQVIIDGELTPYAINTKGELKNFSTGKNLKGTILNGYRVYSLRYAGIQKNIAGHRLVALAFIPNPNNYEIVDHIDGNRDNNIVENLRWVSHSENAVNVHQNIKYTCKENFKKPNLTQEELKNERWVEYLGYKISNLGRVIGKRGQELQGHLRTDGYIKYGNINMGHILIWEAFNGKKEPDMIINHKNGNKADNRLSNLEKISQAENMKKASVETNAWNFSRVGEFDKKGNLLRVFPNATQAGNSIGILPSSMRNAIRNNRTCFNGFQYKYLDK